MSAGTAMAEQAEIGAYVAGIEEGSILQWSEFNHSKNNYSKSKSGTFDDLGDKCSKPTIRADKDGPAFCPCVFNGKVRSNADAIESGLLAFDLDGLPEDTDTSDILASVPGMLAFSYTSHSHLMPGKGARFRLVVAINMPIPAGQVRQVLAAFATKYLGRFAAAIDSKCFNPSRIFYYPSCAADRVDLFEFARQEGAAFDWESLRDTDTPTATVNTPAALPEYLTKMFDGKSNLIPASMKPIVEGNRNSDLFKCASAMRGQGMEQDEIAGELLRLNLERCKPPLPTGEVLDIAASAARYVAGVRKQESLPATKMPVTVSEASGVTELAMAKLIADAYGQHFHYVAESGKYYVLEEKTGVWLEDFAGQIQRWFFDLLQHGKELAFDLIRKQNDAGNKLLSAILKAERQNFIAGAMTLLKSLEKITVRQTIFDANPYLVGLHDGMCVDLRTREVRQIKPADYVTKVLGTHFAAGADCPIWRRCIDDWTRNDANLARFLQVLIGYTLAGLTEIQQFFFLYGAGKNGKSVFVAIVTALMGDYSRTIGAESLMLKQNGAESTNDLARLPGARAIFAPEVREGKSWDEGRVKGLSGGDKIAARFLYGEFFEFVCAAVLFVTGNHKPIVRGNDFGFWRRMCLIPFLATVENPDPDLTNKLLAELPGILNWALEGWKIYQVEGLVIPESVKRESAAYRAEMDIVGQWLDQRTTTLIGNKIKASEVYSNFKDWAITNGFHVPNSSAFGRKLEGRVTTSRDGKGRYYCDLALSYV